MAARIVEYLGIKRGESILDFGCAKGYLVKALHLLGHSAWGIDISKYAISEAPVETKPFLSLDLTLSVARVPYDWIIAKDTFEHIPEDALGNILSALRIAGDHLFVIAPLGNASKYNVPAYDLDTSHVVHRPLDWWIETKSEDFIILRQHDTTLYGDLPI